MKLASNEVQKRFNRIVASWTSSSLRPFSISEDKELQDLIDFAQSTPGKLKLPSRQTNAREINLLADEIRGKIMKMLSGNCKSFSCTSDLWSSRTMNAFMAFTLHFLCEDFKKYNFTLDVKPTVGKHTGEMILHNMKQLLYEWNLREDNIVMLLRDSGSKPIP